MAKSQSQSGNFPILAINYQPLTINQDAWRLETAATVVTLPFLPFAVDRTL